MGEIASFWETLPVKGKGAGAKAKAKDKADDKGKDKAKTDKKDKKPSSVSEMKARIAELEKREGKTPTEFDAYLYPDKKKSVEGSEFHRMTLTQYILKSSKGDQQLAMLMNSIQHASKVTANAIEKA